MATWRDGQCPGLRETWRALRSRINDVQRSGATEDDEERLTLDLETFVSAMERSMLHLEQEIMTQRGRLELSLLRTQWEEVTQLFQEFNMFIWRPSESSHVPSPHVDDYSWRRARDPDLDLAPPANDERHAMAAAPGSPATPARRTPRTPAARCTRRSQL
jgi:hypothetical protein